MKADLGLSDSQTEYQGSEDVERWLNPKSFGPTTPLRIDMLRQRFCRESFLSLVSKKMRSESEYVTGISRILRENKN